MKNNRGQGGIVTGLVIGIAGLVIVAIVSFLIIGALTQSNILAPARQTLTVTNESDNTGAIAFLNRTGFTPANANTTTTGFVATAIWGDYNQSNGSSSAIVNLPSGVYNVSIAAANYSLNSLTGNLTNATTYVFPNVSITYRYQQFAPEEDVINGTIGNFSTGVNNVSTKLPTVLLVAAIVLILGILAILVAVWQKMSIGGNL